VPAQAGNTGEGRLPLVKSSITIINNINVTAQIFTVDSAFY